MILSEDPPMDVHFFPEDIGELCQLQQDGSLLFPHVFTVGKQVKFKNMIFWLNELENFGTIAILRLFCEVAYDEKPPYDYLLALRTRLENGKVKCVEPLCPPQELSEVHNEIIKHLEEASLMKHPCGDDAVTVALS